jgi:uncharacterized protein
MAKPAPKPFAVLVRELPAHRELDVPPVLVSEWVKGMQMRDALGAPDPDPEAGQGHATLDLYLEDDHVFANGQFDGHLVVACSRCVGPARLELHEDLHVTFVPAAQMPAEKAATDDDGAEVESEDLDVFPYDGEVVDLEPLLREQFVLAIPYAPLCREACAGLCPQCGIDRNTATCTCERPVDPRLAALKGLKLPS